VRNKKALEIRIEVSTFLSDQKQSFLNIEEEISDPRETFSCHANENQFLLDISRDA